MCNFVLFNCGFRNLIQQEKYIKGIYSTIFMFTNWVYISDSSHVWQKELSSNSFTWPITFSGNMLCFSAVSILSNLQSLPIIIYNFWGLDGLLIVLSWWVRFIGVKLQMCNVHSQFLDVFRRWKFWPHPMTSFWILAPMKTLSGFKLWLIAIRFALKLWYFPLLSIWACMPIVWDDLISPCAAEVNQDSTSSYLRIIKSTTVCKYHIWSYYIVCIYCLWLSLWHLPHML